MLIITQYSTMLLEAAIFSLPAICIGYGTYRNNLRPARFYEKATHIKTIMKFGSYVTVYNNSELDNKINILLDDKNINSENRNELVNSMFPVRKNIGRNIAKYIEEVIFNTK